MLHCIESGWSIAMAYGLGIAVPKAYECRKPYPELTLSASSSIILHCTIRHIHARTSTTRYIPGNPRMSHLFLHAVEPLVDLCRYSVLHNRLGHSKVTPERRSYSIMGTSTTLEVSEELPCPVKIGKSWAKRALGRLVCCVCLHQRPTSPTLTDSCAG